MRDHLLPHRFEIVDCKLQRPDGLFGRIPRAITSCDISIPRPLLVGHSVAQADDDRVVILGGGATCFSMGTFWNRGPYALHADASKELTESLEYVQTVEIAQGVAKSEGSRLVSAGACAPIVTPIPRVSLQSANDFETMLRRGRPAILSGLSLGSCIASWSLDYIAEKVGPDRKVSRMSMHRPTVANLVYAV